MLYPRFALPAAFLLALSARARPASANGAAPAAPAPSPTALAAPAPSPPQGPPSAAPARQLLADPALLAAWLADRDPVIEAARARVETAVEQHRQTRVLPNPQLSFTASDFVLGKSTTGDDGIDRHLSLGQTTIFTAGISELVELGKRAPRQQAAALRAAEAGEVAVGALGDRVGNATAALGRLAYLAARRDVVAANLAAARQLRDSEKVRLDHQDLSPLEFERIELDTLEVQRQLARADAELAGAAAGCRAALRAPCSPAGLDAAALDAAAPLPEPLPERPAERDAALAARPQRAASRLEARALGQDARLAANRRIPDLTVGVGYTLDNLVVSGDQHQSLAFSIGIPLPLFDRGAHDAAAARAAARALTAEDRASLEEARGLVDTLLAQRAALADTLRQLEAGAVPRSTEIIAQTRRAFDLGQARLADLLLVERAHRDLLIEVLDTRFALFDARAQLRQSLGLDDAVARSLQRSTP